MPSILSSLALFRRFLNVGGRIYRDATFFGVRVGLDAKRARAWLPPGLSLARPNVATVFLAHFPSTTFESVYFEAGILFHVRRRLRHAVFSPWMVVDDDVALVTGRELLGYPKKLAEKIDFVIKGDDVHGSVTRRGAPLLSLEAGLGEKTKHPPPMLGQRVINVRGVGFGGHKLVTFRPREHVVEARTASVHSLVVRSSERDPLAELGIDTSGVLDAHLLRVDVSIGFPPRELRSAGLGFVLRSWSLRNW